MDINTICRTCLSLNEQLIPLFDGSAEHGLSKMLQSFTNIRLKNIETMPTRVCLSCISELNRCFSFKIKCENSNRTLRQLLPKSVEDDPDEEEMLMQMNNAYTQTDATNLNNVASQTIKSENQLQKRIIHQCVQTDINAEMLYASMLEINTKNLEQRKEDDEQRIEENELHEIHEEVIFNFSNADEDEKLEECYEEEFQMDEREPESSTEERITYYRLTTDQLDSIEEQMEEIHAEQSEENANFVVFAGESNESNDGEMKLTIYNDEEEEKQEIKSSRVTRSTNKIKDEYKCAQCGMAFASENWLKRHVAKMHATSSVKKQSMPEIIVFSASSESEKGEHTQEEKEQEEKEQFTTVSLITENEENATYSGPKVKLLHICTDCGGSFAVRKSLLYHRKMKLCKVKNYECNECARVFVTEDNLKEHKATHLLSHVCHECNKVYASSEALSQHMINVHNRNPSHQCTVCKKVFTMLSSLKDHMRVHSGEKPFTCEQCGKSFSQKPNLKQHLLRHSKEKKFKCEFCDSAYVTKAEVTSHRRTHTGDTPYHCNYCESTFSTSSTLAKHKRIHTGERPYSCDICPMRFTALNVMNNHRRTHTGEKPFKCHYCEKCFTQRGDCKIHQRSHTLDFDYDCACGEHFKSLSALRAHKRSSCTVEQNKQKSNKIRTYKSYLKDKTKIFICNRNDDNAIVSQQFPNQHNNEQQQQEEVEEVDDDYIKIAMDNECF